MNKRVAALFAFLFFSFSAQAIDGISVEAGGGNGVSIVRAGAQWKWDKKWLQSGDWHLGGYWDAQVGHWNGASGITDLGFTPTFRFQQNSGRGLYVEGAVGVHYLSSRNITTTKQPGSNLTFGDHIGAGYRFGDRGQYDLSLRLQHHSNAGIKSPNPAINVSLLRFQYWF